MALPSLELTPELKDLTNQMDRNAMRMFSAMDIALKSGLSVEQVVDIYEGPDEIERLIGTGLTWSLMARHEEECGLPIKVDQAAEVIVKLAIAQENSSHMTKFWETSRKTHLKTLTPWETRQANSRASELLEEYEPIKKKEN